MGLLDAPLVHGRHPVRLVAAVPVRHWDVVLVLDDVRAPAPALLLAHRAVAVRVVAALDVESVVVAARKLLRLPLDAIGAAQGELQEALEVVLLAVPEVRGLVDRDVRARAQDGAEARGQEDRVGVHLDGPVVLHEDGVLLDPLPDRDEDVEVQRRLELASHPALQVAVDDARGQPVGHLDRHVAVDGVGLAGEEADTRLELHGQQPLLVSVRQHQREAVHGHVRRADDCRDLRDAHVREGAHLELLVPARRVAGAEEDRAVVPVVFVGVDAGPAPAAEVPVLEGELLVPAVRVAVPEAEAAELRERVGREAEAELVEELARGLRPRPLLAVLAVAGHHLHLAAVVVRPLRAEADAVLGPDDALQDGLHLLEAAVRVPEAVAHLPEAAACLLEAAVRLLLAAVVGRLPSAELARSRCRRPRRGLPVRVVVVGGLELRAVSVRMARVDAQLPALADLVPPGDLLEEADVRQAWQGPRPGEGPAALVGDAEASATLGGADLIHRRQGRVRREDHVRLVLAAAGVDLVLGLGRELAPQRLADFHAALADGDVRLGALVAPDGRARLAGPLAPPAADARAALDVAVVAAGLVEVVELRHRHLAAAADQAVGLVGPRVLVAGRPAGLVQEAVDVLGAGQEADEGRHHHRGREGEAQLGGGDRALRRPGGPAVQGHPADLRRLIREERLVVVGRRQAGAVRHDVLPRAACPLGRDV
mmetsp:Transcript_20815/g.46128  ORF Transcript_20815/g.46128 Transcript_20815/m.46128 type:complete len:710 (-) Transcript_20815:198-2327(-)